MCYIVTVIVIVIIIIIVNPSSSLLWQPSPPSSLYSHLYRDHHSRFRFCDGRLSLLLRLPFNTWFDIYEQRVIIGIITTIMIIILIHHYNSSSSSPLSSSSSPKLSPSSTTSLIFAITVLPFAICFNIHPKASCAVTRCSLLAEDYWYITHQIFPNLFQ